MPGKHSLLIVLLTLTALAVLAAPARALEPDEIVLVVNGDMPVSVQLAEFYARARHIPDGRILKLGGLPAGEEIPFTQYETDVVPAVRAFLRDNRLERKAKCFVTFFGVPLRIAGKRSTPAEKQELAAARRQAAEAMEAVERAVGGLEALATEVSPAPFERAEGTTPEDYVRRADAAVRATANAALRLPDQTKRADALGRLVAHVRDLAGRAAAAELEDKLVQAGPPIAPATRPATAPAPPLPREQVERRVAELQERRFDADARAELRTLAAEQLGLLGTARALTGQVEYLDNDGTAAAFDSELALVWWRYYARSRWQPNLLHHRARAAGATGPPVVMVTRLDGPQTGTARDIIAASLKAERDGLRGRLVIDSRGIAAKERNGKDNGYGQYDESLRRLSKLASGATTMPVTFDDRDAVFAAGSVKDVALYCGWYSVRNYVPAFTFNPGAVGFHVASFELVSLHNDQEKGWVRGLLSDDVAATMGPVAEPYLSAFPPADEFFPLLMTGELTLAEVYWATTPMTSWMMSMIGDPLYRPFATNPQMKPDDLPPPLAGVLVRPTTRPAR